MPRVVMIGLDALTPELVFDSFRNVLPTFARLCAEGLAAPLASSVPPITVPAWAAMVTGVDPGVLGLYGFRQRAKRGYAPGALASSMSHDVPTLWDELGRHGLRSRILGVPLTYPPKPLRGELVAGCLTPSTEVTYTFPPELADEVERLTGGYRIDVPEFRTADPERLLADLVQMTERRFALARDWLGRDDWDFFMMVEMGSDRVQHRFWGEGDVVRDYYVRLDDELGRLLEGLREDDVLLAVSDHGAQALRGAFALNDWLVRAGYLVLRPDHPTEGALDPSRVDWSRTRAWGEGGYVGRLYVNVRGREPEGVVAPADVPALLAEIEAALAGLGSSDARSADGVGPVAIELVRPEAVYREVRGIAPDAMLDVGELAYRVLGTLGHGALWPKTQDRGIDRANHARDGVLILRDGRGPRLPAFAPTLYDVAPTLLDRFGIEAPERMRGRVIT